VPLRLVRSSKPEMPPRESLTYPPPMVTSSPTLAAPSHPARGSCRPELAGRTRANTRPSRRGLARPSAGGCSFSRLGPACRRAAKPGPPRPRAPKNTLAGAPRTGLSPFGGPFLEHRESLLGPPRHRRSRSRSLSRSRVRASLRWGRSASRRRSTSGPRELSPASRCVRLWRSAMLTSRLDGFARSSPSWSLQMPLETPPPRNAKVLPDAARDGRALRAGLKGAGGLRAAARPQATARCAQDDEQEGCEHRDPRVRGPRGLLQAPNILVQILDPDPSLRAAG
jgi:hypothetical protein